MVELKIFFETFKYLTKCVKDSLKLIDRERLKVIFSLLIEARNNKHNVIVDGQGRSLQSMLIMEDCLEHNGFPIIYPANNANLRPWKKGDIFFFNSGSGSGTPLQHAKTAKADGLYVLGMTYNIKIHNEFSEPLQGILILEATKNINSLYAPLGTEFELTSAVIGSAIGYSLSETPEKSLSIFDECTLEIVNLFENTYTFFENDSDPLFIFTKVISDYLASDNLKKIYFCGVGRDAIINQVSAIRFGHLHKVANGIVTKDLRVIYEGHWNLRQPGDLAIVTSGSGSTSQTLNYALQAFISGMRIFGITSFEDSDLGKFSKRVDGCLVLPGREEQTSYFNMPMKRRTNYLPKFELNCYLTMDSLLARIASEHEITEDDMRSSHRLKALE